ncbi:tryptophan synthase subunit alpha [Solibacillus silvestris]|uniref:tryptophan synthase subunit alpha n=1 Tax=Solibacillus silvestris TaxID=76853 RepID=UPI003F7F85FF
MKLQQQLESILAAGDKAFIPYIMAGDGGIETLKPTLLRLQQLGVSAIEVGIPFTDPVADGPTIEQAGERALAHGVTLKKVLVELKSFAQEIQIPLVVMTYLNPVLAYGIEAFAKDAKLGGVQGLIVPDMPYEESALLQTALKENDIALVQLVSLTSHPERIKKLASASEGFIYAVTVNGITGERASFATELAQHFANLKTASNIPVLAGFGISTAEHVKSFGEIADGVIVGSRIVTALAEDDWTTIETLVQATKKSTII